VTPSRYVTLKLDIGVTVMEILSGSRDFVSLSFTGRCQPC